MTKEETLARWNRLPAGLPILKHFEPIPYKATGSTYGACGIRIDGTPEFVDAVMSRLKDLIAGEAIETRLGLSRRAVDGSGIGKALPNQATESECCYIRLHERGHEGMILAAYDETAKARKVVTRTKAAAIAFA